MGVTVRRIMASIVTQRPESRSNKRETAVSQGKLDFYKVIKIVFWWYLCDLSGIFTDVFVKEAWKLLYFPGFRVFLNDCPVQNIPWCSVFFSSYCSQSFLISFPGICTLFCDNIAVGSSTWVKNVYFLSCLTELKLRKNNLKSSGTWEGMGNVEWNRNCKIHFGPSWKMLVFPQEIWSMLFQD